MQKLTRWGNSWGIRIPLVIAKSAGLSPGDYLSIRLMDSGDLRLRPEKNAQPAEPLMAKPQKVTPW